MSILRSVLRSRGGGTPVTLTRNEDGTVTARIGGASTGTLAYSIDGAAWVVVEDATLPYTIPGVGSGNAVEAVGSATQSLSPTAFDVLLNARLTSGRVDFVGLGDSNQVLSGHGWDHGMQYALSQSFPMYATGLLSPHENQGSGSGTGYAYSVANSVGKGAYFGAPSGLEEYYLDGGFHNYGYVADGDSIASTGSYGLGLAGSCPLGNGGALQFDYHYGQFTTGSGQFGVSIRIDESPWTKVTSGTVTSSTGSEGMSIHTLTIPADSGRDGKIVGMKWVDVGVAGVTGPFFGLWQRVSRPDVLTGYCYHTLMGLGGQSARDMALWIQGQTDTALSYYFTEVRRLQGATKTVVICINEGMNDRGETETSVGPSAVTDGDSAEAFVDNHTAIVNRIKEIWTLNGWSQDELFWLFMPSHPVSNPDDAELLSYRAALATYAGTLSQATVVDLESLTDADAMLAAGYYASGGSDVYHLTQSGYENLGATIIDAAT